MKCVILLSFFLVFVQFSLVSDSFSTGKSLFEENSVEDALYYFEEALITSPTPEVYKYLAESYTILGMFEDATLVLEEAIDSGLGDKSYFYLKLGNGYYSIGEYKGALDSYLEVIKLNSGYVKESFLNVANVSVDLKLFSSAIDNYTKYLELSPKDPQKRKIVKMILLLKRALREETLKAKEKAMEEDRKNQTIAQREEDSQDYLLSPEQRALLESDTRRLEEDKAVKEQQLLEERALFSDEEDAINKDRIDLLEDEKKVINPPDPAIEARKDELRLREDELRAWEDSIKERERELEEAIRALNENKRLLDKDSRSVIEEPKPELTQEDLDRMKAIEEQERLKREEELRQKALMDDILESLEKIGENAKTINAASEEAIGDLEGSDIDE